MLNVQEISSSGYSLHLMPLWELWCNAEPVHVCLRQQRLLALLAIQGQCRRELVAGLLWPESSDASAQDNLRVSIHRVNHSLPGLLSVDRHSVGIDPSVPVDLHREWSLLQGNEQQAHPSPPGKEPLLLGWYEDWVLEAQLRLLHARTAYWRRTAGCCLVSGDYRGAVESAAHGLRLDMLDEAALEIMVAAQLALGQCISAMGAIEGFRRTAGHELGMSGSPALDRLEAQVRGVARGSLIGARAAAEPFSI